MKPLSLSLVVVMVVVAMSVGVESSPPPTAVYKTCEQVTLKWACVRREPTCNWRGGNGPNAYCTTAGSQTTGPTQYKDCVNVTMKWACTERRSQGCRWVGSACVQESTHPPSDTLPPSPTRPPVPKTPHPTHQQTSPPVTCGKSHDSVSCDLLLGRCTWDTTTNKCISVPKTKSPTMHPTTAQPSRHPTRSPPRCEIMIGKKACCGQRFASGKGGCVNNKVHGGCTWNSQTNTCLSKHGTQIPTGKTTSAPTPRPGGHTTPTTKAPAGKPVGKTTSPTFEYEAEYEPTAKPTKKAG